MYLLIRRIKLAIVCTIVCGGILHAQGRYTVVISEIMADPTPQVGLPNAEWLELRNASSTAINLGGWRLAKSATTLSGPIVANTILAPDSSIVICTSSQVAALSAFGRTTAVTSFPSLGNDGDMLWLQNSSGAIVHAVEYSIGWYRNNLKADGGWTLEMIDPRNPCGGAANWLASTDVKGGTPGQPNSVFRANADQTPPQLLRAFATDSLTVVLTFSEGLDSTKAANTIAYTMSNGIGVRQATVLPPFFSKVQLSLNQPLQRGITYTVNAANSISDCAGNAPTAAGSTRTGLTTAADSLDVIVNEILFNPKPQAADYVEVYNRSNKLVNLRTTYLANRSSTTLQVGSIVALSADDRILFPGEWVVATADPVGVSTQYNVAQPGNLLTIGSMPSYPDDKGWAILLNQQGIILDEVPYLDDWHFALADNKEGLALERIAYNGPSNQADNWTSASQTAGFGTPTAANSQLKAAGTIAGTISVTPKLFSPDNDGFEDYAFIQFQFTEPGYVANVTLLDAAGRTVRQLQRNTTCSAQGSFRWDGLNDKQQRVTPGTYIVLFEIFNLQGKKQQFKQTVTVARRF